MVCGQESMSSTGAWKERGLFISVRLPNGGCRMAGGEMMLSLLQTGPGAVAGRDQEVGNVGDGR